MVSSCKCLPSTSQGLNSRDTPGLKLQLPGNLGREGQRERSGLGYKSLPCTQHTKDYRFEGSCLYHETFWDFASLRAYVSRSALKIKYKGESNP